MRRWGLCISVVLAVYLSYHILVKVWDVLDWFDRAWLISAMLLVILGWIKDATDAWEKHLTDELLR